MRAGDEIQAKLIEEVEKNRWIVSFQGQLLQVRNTTPIPFEKNRSLQLRVIKTMPLELQVLDPRRPIKGLNYIA